MKDTVIEYVENEIEQLTKERESLQKANRMLEEIEIFFGDFKLDSFERLIYSSSIKNDDNQLPDYRKKLMATSTTNLSAPVERSNNQRPDFFHRASFQAFPSGLSKSRSIPSIPTTYQNEHTKKEQYRQDLLEQIRGDKARKAAQHQLDNELDADIERKISRQQMMMYMEQLAERERGDFVKRNPKKTIEKNVQMSSYKHPVKDFKKIPNPGNNAHRELNHHGLINDQRKQHKNDHTKIVKADQLIVKEYGKLERNILSNLNEVRKIMQCDHVEMLERLLDL